jgi:hypothetical protein
LGGWQQSHSETNVWTVYTEHVCQLLPSVVQEVVPPGADKAENSVENFSFPKN